MSGTPPFQTRGRFKAATNNRRRSIPNTLLQPAFDLVAALLTGSTTTNRFSGIALLDNNEATIASKGAVFSAAPLSPGPGTLISGSASFLSSEVTAAIHFLELRDVNGVPLARAAVDPPLPANESLLVLREDLFVQGTFP